MTWLGHGPHEVHETTDLTEDDRRSTTRTCTGRAMTEYGSAPKAIGCS